jgi:lysophospholipase L1-like esterase
VSACRFGLLAFGDSITNGGGELQWGVALQSWALWVARALKLPYSPFAADGARAADVLSDQIPAVPEDARYDVGCLYVGVNDVRAADWDPAAFERDHAAALARIRGRCDRVLTLTLPLDLGRPRATARARAANQAIVRSARQADAIVLDLEAFGARNLVMPDHVHPTAFGQIAIAERALDALAAAGLTAVVRPSTLISYKTTAVGRLRGDLTYAYRHAKVSARDVAITARQAWDRRRAA